MVKADPFSVQFSVTTPFPGTAYFDECERNHLLCSRQWSDYDGNACSVIRTRALSPHALMRARAHAYMRWKRHVFIRRFKNKSAMLLNHLWMRIRSFLCSCLRGALKVLLGISMLTMQIVFPLVRVSTLVLKYGKRAHVFVMRDIQRTRKQIGRTVHMCWQKTHALYVKIQYHTAILVRILRRMVIGARFILLSYLIGITGLFYLYTIYVKIVKRGNFS